MVARLFLLISVAAAFVFAPSGAQADSIGDVVSVVPAANYRRGGQARELQQNDLLEQNDRVITTGNGSAYIHFIDNTVLTVGENSEVLLDKFIFDGDKAKTATVQLVRGTLRFVTGLSDHRAYQIKTPVATIGVRGTTIDTSYENERMVYNTVEGLGVVCHANAGCQDIRAGAEPIAVTRGGFGRATAAEAVRIRSVINRSHNMLAQRIGRNPSSMLAFARSRGATFARGQAGRRELQKDLKQKDRKDSEQRGQKGLGQKESGGQKDFRLKNLKTEYPKSSVGKEKRRFKNKRF